MIPGVYGFSWSVGNIIFLGIFYCAVLSVLCTVAVAAHRAIRDVRGQHDETIRWRTDFGELPAAARVCRHQLAGEVRRRTCDHQFECGTCAVHKSLMEKRAAEEGAATSAASSPSGVLGFDAPAGLLYHRGHTWVRLEPDGTATVGLDDFGSRLMGKPDEVDFPEIGSALQLDGTGFRFKRGGSTVRVLSPLEGELIATGGPGQEWYLRLKPVREVLDVKHLLQGAEVQSWILRESERLQLALAAEGSGLSLADGGEMVEDVPGACPEADWDTIWGDMFLEP